MSSHKDTINMTRADLYDWVRFHGCIIKPIPEYKAKIIKVENPRNGFETWINLPIDDTPVRDYTVFDVCNKLGIQIPTCATYMKPINDRIETEHNIKKNLKRG